MGICIIRTAEFCLYLINRYVSVYSNAAYTYDGKYMVSGSIRWDKTNLFSTGSKYQKRPIWSVGAGWNVDREKFFHVSWVNMLKLRASYGIGGNIAKNSAPYMIAYYSNNNQVGGIQGTYMGNYRQSRCGSGFCLVGKSIEWFY